MTLPPNIPEISLQPRHGSPNWAQKIAIKPTFMSDKVAQMQQSQP